MLKTDTQLQKDVIDELRWDARVGNTELGVAVKDGVVTLTGQVENYVRKFDAVKAAERVFGVRAIADDITVMLPSATTRTDTDLAHAVANAMRWDIQVPDDKVKARIENGWVTLEGEVQWQYEAAAAGRAVRNLTGVRGVTNVVRVAKHTHVPDVKTRIEKALLRQAEVDSKAIQVDAIDGKVTLSGSVHSFAGRRRAELAAWSAPGVTFVEDDLLVRY